MGAGNPLGYDYRDPAHVARYEKLVIRHPTGETEASSIGVSDKLLGNFHS